MAGMLAELQVCVLHINSDAVTFVDFVRYYLHSCMHKAPGILGYVTALFGRQGSVASFFRLQNRRLISVRQPFTNISRLKKI